MKYFCVYTNKNKTDWTNRDTETVLEYLKNSHKSITLRFGGKYKSSLLMTNNHCTLYKYGENGNSKTVSKEFAIRFINAYKKHCKRLYITDKKNNTFIFKISE